MTDWIKERRKKKNELIGNISFPKHVGRYDLEENNEDYISYVGRSRNVYDDGDYLVYMGIRKWDFKDRDKPLYILDGFLKGLNNDVEKDFRPSTRTQFESLEKAKESLVDIMMAYDPSDAVHDEVII